MPDHWRDYRGLPVSGGNIVLDDEGNVWRVTDDGGYGRTNAAVCYGIGYTKKQGKAVRIGLSFRLDVDSLPGTPSEGVRLFEALFDQHVRPDMERALKARRWQGLTR